MRYFRIVDAVAAAAVALTVLACFTGIYSLLVRSTRTVYLYRIMSSWCHRLFVALSL